MLEAEINEMLVRMLVLSTDSKHICSSLLSHPKEMSSVCSLPFLYDYSMLDVALKGEG